MNGQGSMIHARGKFGEGPTQVDKGPFSDGKTSCIQNQISRSYRSMAVYFEPAVNQWLTIQALVAWKRKIPLLAFMVS